MSSYTNSEHVTYNEDGSVTTSLTYTEMPATKKEQLITSLIALGVVGLMFAPLTLAVAADWNDRRKEKKAKKAEESKKEEN